MIWQKIALNQGIFRFDAFEGKNFALNKGMIRFDSFEKRIAVKTGMIRFDAFDGKNQEKSIEFSLYTMKIHGKTMLKQQKHRKKFEDDDFKGSKTIYARKALIASNSI